MCLPRCADLLDTTISTVNALCESLHVTNPLRALQIIPPPVLNAVASEVVRDAYVVESIAC